MTPPRNGVQPHRIRLNAPLPRWFGRDGITIGIWTLLALDHCPAELRAHENRHVWHGRKTLFVGFWVAYLVEFAIRFVVEACRVRPVAPLRRWWWKRVIDGAYHGVSWERDAYDWAKRHWPEFDAIEPVNARRAT